MKLKAFAKINLGLDVIGRREDGYHQVRMIMQTIRMFDQLEIEKSSTPGIRLSVNLPYVPTDAGNLVYRAASLLMEEFSISEGVEIRLNKFIPVAAGMAGGSSDAAATLVGLNRLFDLGLSRQELMERGLKLGADVPYCVMGGTALAEGIGEKLTRISPLPPCYILIGKPGVSVSTKFVYTNLKLDGHTVHPDIDGILDALKAGNLQGVTENMGNVLESVTIPRHPVIEQIKDLMKEEGALNALMSGSGPTVFGIFDDIDTARKAQQKLKDSHLARQVFLAEAFHNGGTEDDQ